MATFHLSTRTSRIKGKTVNAANHYAYITRQGKYASIEDLTYMESGRLPNCDELKSQKDFWLAADEYKRKNGRTYTEVTIGLQEEFTKEENIELIHKFLDHFGIRDKQVYAFAIHDKQASYDVHHRNVHCHIMFNERILTDRKFEHSEEIFKRWAGPIKQNEKGGLQIDRYFNNRNFVKDMRDYWEKLNNEKFKEIGSETRISSKSLKAQRKKLIEEGRYKEAEAFNRSSPKHMGPAFKYPDVKEEVMAMANKIEDERNEDLKLAEEQVIASLEKQKIPYEGMQYYTRTNKKETIDKKEEMESMADNPIKKDKSIDLIELLIEDNIYQEELEDSSQYEEETESEAGTNQTSTSDEPEENIQDLPPIFFDEQLESEIYEEEFYSSNNISKKETSNYKNKNSTPSQSKQLEEKKRDKWEDPPAWNSEEEKYQDMANYYSSYYDDLREENSRYDMRDSDDRYLEEEDPFDRGYDYNKKNHDKKSLWIEPKEENEFEDAPPFDESQEHNTSDNYEEIPPPFMESLEEEVPNDMPFEEVTQEPTPKILNEDTFSNRSPDIPFNEESFEDTPYDEVTKNDFQESPYEEAPPFIDEESFLLQEEQPYDEVSFAQGATIPEEEFQNKEIPYSDFESFQEDAFPKGEPPYNDIEQNINEEEIPVEDIPFNEVDFAEDLSSSEDIPFNEVEVVDKGQSKKEGWKDTPYDNKHKKEVSKKRKTSQELKAKAYQKAYKDEYEKTAEEMIEEIASGKITKETFDKLVSLQFQKLQAERKAKEDEKRKQTPPSEDLNKEIFENKKRLMAEDIVLRRIIRLAQLDKADLDTQRQRRVLHQMQKHGFDESIATDGVIITVSDVCKEIGELHYRELNKITRLKDKIKKRDDRVQINTPNEVLALDRLTDGNYSKTITKLNELNDKIKELQKVTKAPVEDVKDYLAKSKEEEEIAKKRDQVQETIDKQLAKAHGEFKDLYYSYLKKIAREKKIAEKYNNADMKAIEKHQELAELLIERRKALAKALPKETILYGDPIPEKVFLTSKINGIKLSRKPFVATRNGVYMILNAPKEPELGKQIELQCVKLGEKAPLGKAKVYNATILVEQKKIGASGKIIPQYVPLAVASTEKTVLLYSVNNQETRLKLNPRSPNGKGRTIKIIASNKVPRITMGAQGGYSHGQGALAQLLQNSVAGTATIRDKVQPDEKTADRKSAEAAKRDDVTRDMALENEQLENGEWVQQMRQNYGRRR